MFRFTWRPILTLWKQDGTRSVLGDGGGSKIGPVEPMPRHLVAVHEPPASLECDTLRPSSVPSACRRLRDVPNYGLKAFTQMAWMDTYMHTYIHKCIQTDRRTHIHTGLHTCVYTPTCISTHICMYAYVHTYASSCSDPRSSVFGSCGTPCRW